MKYQFIFLFSLLLLAACDTGEKTEISRAQELYLQGNEYYNDGNNERAIDYYSMAIQLDPDHAPAYLKRGDAKRKLRDHVGAIRDYDRCIELRPTGARAWFHRGTLKWKTGDKEGGCEDVQKAKELVYMPAEKFYRNNCE